MSALEDAYARAREVYPDVIVAESDFAAYARERCDRQLDDFLAANDPAELYLALACVNGDPAAIARFDADYLGEVVSGASRLRPDPGELDDIRQEVRRLLLVGGPDARLRSVTGRGDLRALIRLMALRAGISLRRKSARDPLIDADLIELVDDRESPALGLARAQHRRMLSDALARAVAGLPAKQRAVLKLHCLDGVGLAQLATMHRVDRSTISRWIVRARRAVLAATRRHLAEAGVANDHFDSFIDVLRSNFELSLRRMLDGEAQPAEVVPEGVTE